jgi:predicted aldo/keto reductase-like oxidoreductase
MDYVRLGKTGMMVSRIGFGGIPIQRLSEGEAISVVNRCLELGVNFVDTANAYSTSEERIGKAIAGRRKEIILATKSGALDNDEMRGHLKLSLERLGTDYLDLYQFHGLDTFDELDAVLNPGGPISVAEEAKKNGVIRHIGITTHSMDVAKKAVESDRFETIMFPFNFITCEPADQLLPLTREHDMGFIVMKPLAGGMLDNASLAFKYLFQFPDAVPIPGIEKAEEMEEIVNLLDGARDLAETEEQQIRKLREELGNRFCRRCDYCQPCPEEITISSVMTARSFAKRLPTERLFSGRIAETMETAANCTQCGECEDRCPYHLTIRDIIVEEVEWYQAECKRYKERVGA